MKLVNAVFAAAAVALVAPLACNGESRPLDDAPTYRDRVASILDAKCARCHGGDSPAAGFRVDRYRGALACNSSGAAASLSFTAALARPDHREVVDDAERATLERWIATGAQSVRSGVHAPAFADPRSPTGHVALLRTTRHRALTDPNDPDACAACHEGAGPRPAGVTLSAPGATACTTCHAEPAGVSECSTCHGAPGRPYPPRDACFFPGAAQDDPHGAHAAPSRSRAEGLDCASCHPRPATGALEGTHGDGHVEVWFDYALAARRDQQAAFDPGAKRCTGTCHDRGGSEPNPTWATRPAGAGLDCNSCHASPPKPHYPGPCSSCHREANDTGTALTAPRLHVNGKVDVGDGSGRCGACHGSGDSSWPTTGAHAAHAAPLGAAPIACETCHVVPGPNDAHPSHAGAAVVRLAGLATKGGAPATYDAATRTCASTYCHAGRGAQMNAPRWTDGAPARACGACHATPPPPPHPQNLSCGSSSCHEGITSSATEITPQGRVVHVNGRIDRRAP